MKGFHSQKEVRKEVILGKKCFLHGYFPLEDGRGLSGRLIRAHQGILD